MVALPPMAPRFGIWAVLLAAALGFGVLAMRLVGSPDPVRVLLLPVHLDDRGRDLGPGLAALLADTLEVVCGATVVQAQAAPSSDELKRLPGDLWLLRAQGTREAGDQLTLLCEWTTPRDLLAGRPWRREETGRDDPARILERELRRWPFPVRHPYLGRLVPSTPPRFWSLLEGLAIRSDQEATAHLAASQRLAEEEPGCATAWVALGDHLYRSLWVNPQEAGIGLNSRTHRAFQQATARVPGHPRATFLWSLMLTDTGNQGLALKHLQEAVRFRPGCPDLYLGLAYAGRTSGLLTGARRALAHRQALLGPLEAPSAWFAETTYLYLGDREAFARELAQAGALRRDASILFYEGYFELMKGNPSAALAHLSLGSHPAMAPTPFRDLCRVYRAYLEGRTEAGLSELREMDEIRGKLRIPDGEWTFKEAEAYALLGDGERAMDCATRAFVQGFSCAAWYEGSPFLAKAREHPRWPMLRRNVRERQAVLEGSFPPAAFAP